MGFYGNATLDGKTILQLDKIYPNKKTLDEKGANDGIAPGRYVLVDYQYNVENSDENWQIDINNGATESFDSTIWMKSFNEQGRLYYLMVARLSAKMPEVKMIVNAPSQEGQKPTLEKTGEFDYKLTTNAIWGIKEDIKINTTTENATDSAKWIQSSSQKKYGEDNITRNDTYQLSLNLPTVGTNLQRVESAITTMNNNWTAKNTELNNLIGFDSDTSTNTIKGCINIIKDWVNEPDLLQTEF